MVGGGLVEDVGAAAEAFEGGGYGEDGAVGEDGDVGLGGCFEKKREEKESVIARLT